ncbi:MAG: hypothetical protein IGS48_03645 [Oscillatoriales cyanobacterium C42_A2020_001]|nr:hypothetical protein [Leptolyngbyaceae cyanobacterium C42_A2020_001]
MTPSQFFGFANVHDRLIIIHCDVELTHFSIVLVGSDMLYQRFAKDVEAFDLD